MIWAGDWWLFGAVLLVAGLAGYEFSQLMRRGGHAPSTVFILVIVGLLALDAQFPQLRLIRPGLTGILILSISWQLFQAKSRAPVTDWALTVTGGLYLGLLSAYMIRLRALPAPKGVAWVVLALLITWSNDSAAYFVGRAMGRHKLWPRLSPRKTWEGLMAGVLGGVLAGAVVGYLALRWGGVIGPVHGALVGLLAAIVDPFGDLAISMIKRQVHVKDSSHLIPGHGGLLDRTDSLLFVVVVTYYYAVWFAGG